MENNLLFEIQKFSDISPEVIKKLKKLCRKMTGEILKILDGHLVVFAYYKKNIICMCCISLFSPEKHFDNESDENIPYLYNFICDSSFRYLKNSAQLMIYLKQYISEQLKAKYINLDIVHNNQHAINFFEKNGFKYVGEYDKDFGRAEKYKKYTFTF